MSTYEQCVERAKILGYRFERQAFSTTYDVRDKDGKWLCFDHDLSEHFRKMDEGGHTNANS